MGSMCSIQLSAETVILDELLRCSMYVAARFWYTVWCFPNFAAMLMVSFQHDNCWMCVCYVDVTTAMSLMTEGLSNFAISTQFRTIELRYTLQCSSGCSNLATRFIASRDYWPVLYVLIQFRTLELATRFNTVQGYWTLLYVLKQFRTLELCHTFQCRSGLSNLATLSMQFRAFELGYTFNAV